MSNAVWNHWWGSRFVKTPLNNGVGRYVQQLQRITLKFCKTSGGSLGTREYIEKDLVEFAKDNPGVVVYVKPRRHRSSCIKAEYLNGGSEYISTHKLPRDDIIRWMEYVNGRSGYTTERLRKGQHTDNPSIQGIWTPWMHRHPQLNITQYPNEDLSHALKTEETATDQLVELYKKHKLIGDKDS